MQGPGLPSNIGHVPVHIGTWPPEHWDEIETTTLTLGPGGSLFKESRPTVLKESLDWRGLGIEPRWLGMETSDCSASINPSIYDRRGADELDRFVRGAAARGDTAVCVVTIGRVDDDSPRSLLSPYDATAHLGSSATNVAGRRLPPGTKVVLAENLNGVEADLGRRLLGTQEDRVWWSLELDGVTSYGGSGWSERIEPEGRLVPVLVTLLGESVVAYWEPPDEAQRWYVIPDGVLWQPVLEWLVRQALPHLAPKALQTLRAPFLAHPELMTKREQRVSTAITQIEQEFADRRRELQAELDAATAHADPIRDGLLYGTGDVLKDAVAAVLVAAECNVGDLDEVLGRTNSADLLVSYSMATRLVEVKAASGRPGEALVDDLLRHLRTWPELGQTTPVTGGTLIINYQHRLAPTDRQRQPYTRREFVAALRVGVVGTLDLFESWRAEDWEAIRSMVLGTTTRGPEEAEHMPSRWPWQRSRPA